MCYIGIHRSSPRLCGIPHIVLVSVHPSILLPIYFSYQQQKLGSKLDFKGGTWVTSGPSGALSIQAETDLCALPANGAELFYLGGDLSSFAFTFFPTPTSMG